METTPQNIPEAIDWLRKASRPELASGLRSIYQVDLTGPAGGSYWVRIDDGRLSSGEGSTPQPDLVMCLAASDFYDVLGGRANPELLFMENKVDVRGPLSLALKLRALFLSA